TDPSAPMVELQVDAAHQRVRELTGREPGEGVGVAVVGAGVRSQPAITSTKTQRAAPYSRTGEQIAWEPTAAARLVAGARRQGEVVGVAPAAPILDVRVYDTAEPAPSQDLGQATSAGVAAGLRAVAPLVGPRGVRVVVVPVHVPASRELRRAVRAVTRAGAL